MLVIPAYLAVFVFEREATVLNMLAGSVLAPHFSFTIYGRFPCSQTIAFRSQLVNEAWSWVLKRYIKSERPFGKPSVFI
jgi:hypothetical protein